MDISSSVIKRIMLLFMFRFWKELIMVELMFI